MSDDDSFFSRWSRRKAQLRSGEVPPDKPPRAESPRDAPQPAVPANAPRIDTPQSAARSVQAAVAPTAGAQPPDTTPAALPAPTLADVARLTPTSDFSRFVGRDVDASVQHAALKTLFSDPHFNVMDGLDTYIGDYNTPDPIPDAMLRRLLQAKTLRIFDDPSSGADVAQASAEPERMTPTPAPADGALTPTLAQSATPTDIEASEPELKADTHEDIALRLQPDDAADAAGAGSHRPGPRA